jgi:DNA polymerase III, delta subunit
MSLAAALDAARRGCLYPALILHGRDAAARQQAAVELARILLCAEPAPEDRPCGVCRHCRRIAWPEAKAESGFHPDFQVLERDLKTSTSVEATRELLRAAQVTPFEARGQVFVVASAETLSGEAANALLKTLEEPHLTAPRHFLLLAPSGMDLLPTLRSRSLAVFLGPAETIDAAAVEPLARSFTAALSRYSESGAAIYLLTAAEALAGAGGWEDPRAGRPWSHAATAVVRSLDLDPDLPAAARRARLALAEALLGGPLIRMRGIAAERILEGLVARHLAA